MYISPADQRLICFCLFYVLSIKCFTGLITLKYMRPEPIPACNRQNQSKHRGGCKLHHMTVWGWGSNPVSFCCGEMFYTCSVSPTMLLLTLLNMSETIAAWGSSKAAVAQEEEQSPTNWKVGLPASPGQDTDNTRVAYRCILQYMKDIHSYVWMRRRKHCVACTKTCCMSVTVGEYGM